MIYRLDDNSFDKHTLNKLFKKLHYLYSFNYLIKNNQFDTDLYFKELNKFDEVKRQKIIKLTLHDVKYLEEDFDFFIDLLE